MNLLPVDALICDKNGKLYLYKQEKEYSLNCTPFISMTILLPITQNILHSF